MYDKPLACYAGSFVSLNQGEYQRKGFLLWDIYNRTVESVIIRDVNRYRKIVYQEKMFYDMENKELCNSVKDLELEKTNRIQIIININKNDNLETVSSGIRELFQDYEYV